MRAVENISQHFQADLLSQGPIWYEADSLSDLICICFSCHLWCPSKSVSGLYGDWVVTLQSADTIWAPEGPHEVCTPPPYKHKSITDESIQWMNSHHWSKTISDAMKLLMISVEAEHWWNIYVAFRVSVATKGMRRPSLMLIILLKEQLKSNTMLRPWQMWLVWDMKSHASSSVPAANNIRSDSRVLLEISISHAPPAFLLSRLECKHGWNVSCIYMQSPCCCDCQHMLYTRLLIINNTTQCDCFSSRLIAMTVILFFEIENRFRLFGIQEKVLRKGLECPHTH